MQLVPEGSNQRPWLGCKLRPERWSGFSVSNIVINLLRSGYAIPLDSYNLIRLKLGIVSGLCFFSPRHEGTLYHLLKPVKGRVLSTSSILPLSRMFDSIHLKISTLCYQTLPWLPRTNYLTNYKQTNNIRPFKIESFVILYVWTKLLDVDKYMHLVCLRILS